MTFFIQHRCPTIAIVFEHVGKQRMHFSEHVSISEDVFKPVATFFCLPLNLKH